MMNDGLKRKGPKLVTAFSVAEAPAPDSDVIKRAQHGDSDAFAALFASKIPLKETGFSQRQPDQFQ
jgi:hypothetical protein